jgi:hypothetical protein
MLINPTAPTIDSEKQIDYIPPIVIAFPTLVSAAKSPPTMAGKSSGNSNYIIHQSNADNITKHMRVDYNELLILRRRSNLINLCGYNGTTHTE